MSYSTFKLFTKQMLHPVMMLFAALYDRTKIGIMGNAIPPPTKIIYMQLIIQTDTIFPLRQRL